MSNTQIPAKPLLDFIADNYGTIDNLPGIVGAQEDQELAQRREFDRASKVLERAKRDDTLTLFAADDFCITLLGVHPFQVYGQSWFAGVASMREEHGLAPRVVKVSPHKLTPAKVLEIRARCAAGEKHASVAEAFGCSLGSVEKVVSRERWGWVEEGHVDMARVA